MRIISSDGIGIRALLGAAEKLHEITEERGVTLGVIHERGVGTAVLIAKGNAPRLAVTVEKNPKLITWTDDA